jgi:hypothetical protein
MRRVCFGIVVPFSRICAAILTQFRVLSRKRGTPRVPAIFRNCAVMLIHLSLPGKVPAAMLGSRPFLARPVGLFLSAALATARSLTATRLLSIFAPAATTFA